MKSLVYIPLDHVFIIGILFIIFLLFNSLPISFDWHVVNLVVMLELQVINFGVFIYRVKSNSTICQQ